MILFCIKVLEFKFKEQQNLLLRIVFKLPKTIRFIFILFNLNKTNSLNKMNFKLHINIVLVLSLLYLSLQTRLSNSNSKQILIEVSNSTVVNDNSNSSIIDNHGSNSTTSDTKVENSDKNSSLDNKNNTVHDEEIHNNTIADTKNEKIQDNNTTSNNHSSEKMNNDTNEHHDSSNPIDSNSTDSKNSSNTINNESLAHQEKENINEKNTTTQETKNNENNIKKEESIPKDIKIVASISETTVSNENNIEKKISKLTTVEFNERLNLELKEFEEKYPSTYSDSIIDLIFGVNFFKKQIAMSLFGYKTEKSFTEEYEEMIFKKKRQDVLIKLSYELFLFEIYKKNEASYYNNVSRLRKKTPFAELSYDQVVKTEEYKEWRMKFYQDNKATFSCEDEVEERFKFNYSYIIQDFEEKLVYQQYNTESN